MTETVDPRVIQTILLARIERRLAALQAQGGDPARDALPFDQTKRYQYLDIAAGETAIVWDYVFRGYEIHVYSVGCKWFPNTYFDWIVDGTLRERVRRTIGSASSPMSQPSRLDPPIIAKRRIRWVAHNEDTEVDGTGAYVNPSHVFEVFMDGVLYRPGGAALG